MLYIYGIIFAWRLLLLQILDKKYKRKKMKKILVALLLSIFIQNSHAELLTYNGYTLDDETDVVTGGDLEWLQWDRTLGQSVDSALSVFARDGWRLANNIEMAELFNAFGFGASFTWDSEETTDQFSYNDDGAIENVAIDPEKQFVTLFGNTRPDFCGNPTISDPCEHTGALFGDSLDAINGTFNFAEVSDDFSCPLCSTSYFFGVAGLHSIGYPGTLPLEGFGVALVRTSLVPEPNTLLLFFVFALTLATRKK